MEGAGGGKIKKLLHSQRVDNVSCLLLSARGRGGERGGVENHFVAARQCP